PVAVERLVPRGRGVCPRRRGRGQLPAVAAAAAAAAEPTAARARRPTTTAATRRRLRLLDLQPPALVVTPVETRDGFLRPLVRCHLDEPEAARAAGVAIGHDGRGGHLADLGE